MGVNYRSIFNLEKVWFYYCGNLPQYLFYNIGPRHCIYNTPFSSLLTNRPNKLDRSITQLEILTSDEHSNLLG